MATREYRISLAILAFAAAVVLLLWATSGVTTKPFVDRDGKTIPGSIALIDTVTIRGIKERVIFRGISTKNPVLILLHGGPGASENPLFRHYDPGLERHFLVVYWDQPGAGRSFPLRHPPKDLSIDRFVSDLDALVAIVKTRFHVRKVALLGHSWGTVIGTLYAYRHPENVSVYVGTGQVSDEPESELVSYAWTLHQAKTLKNRRAEKALESFDPLKASRGQMRIERHWVEVFGGLSYGHATQDDLILSALRTDEASWVDLIRFAVGVHNSSEQIWPFFRSIQLDRCCRDFKVPVVFLEGRNDWQVPSVVARWYFDEIRAPYKQFVWFNRSSHNVPFDQPETFVRVMIDVVLPLAKGIIPSVPAQPDRPGLPGQQSRPVPGT